VWPLWLNDCSRFSYICRCVDLRRLQSCLLWSINCESDKVCNILVFLNLFTSSLLIPVFPFLHPFSCLLPVSRPLNLHEHRCSSQCNALFIALYINIIQTTAMVLDCSSSRIRLIPDLTPVHAYSIATTTINK